MSRVSFVNTRGATLEVYQAGDGENLALCLHGFPEHAISWRHQVGLLVDQGYTVWIPNLRGYGRSSRPADVQSYRLGHLLEDLTDLVSAADRRSVTLLGHDWGALLCWAFAARPGCTIDRMVVLGIYHPTMPGGRRWKQLIRHAAYLPLLLTPGVAEISSAGLLFPGVARALELLLPASVDGRSRQIYLDNLRQPGAITAMANYYRANISPATWRAAGLENVLSMPVLMINGANDPWIGSEMIAGTERLAPALTAQLLDGVSHWPHMEQPDEVNRLISDWLEYPQTSR